MALNLYAASTEYVHVPVTASVTLDTQTVEFAFLTGPTPTPDADTAWLPATWAGDAGMTRDARVLVGPGGDTQLEPDTYAVFVRVHDTPETPVRKSGEVTVA